MLGDDYAREVWAKHPCVEHRWLDSTADYFRQLAAWDLVYGVRADAEDSHYRNLVFPQKVFDALAVGRPVRVGSENWVSKWVLEREVGYASSLRDADGMAAVFSDCLARRHELPALSARARRLFKERYDWLVTRIPCGVHGTARNGERAVRWVWWSNGNAGRDSSAETSRPCVVG
jgi:hypothetical protein